MTAASSWPEFLFVVCQRGAEQALKAELARHHPQLRFAFSRPGFVTFKIGVPAEFGRGARLRSTFARAWGWSLDRVSDSEPEAMAAQAVTLLPDRKFRHIHVWQPDPCLPGERPFEPFPTQQVAEVGAMLQGQTLPSGFELRHGVVNSTAQVGDSILDCVLLGPQTWWIGWHEASTVTTRWPGGVPLLKPREDVISRAFWKMQEALLWSRLPIRRGDRCAELGSAPGGACQALLERGLHVLGIDPAKMDPLVAKYPNFTHVRARAVDLKRREFSGIPWLVADANVAPKYTLDALEGIVTHRRVHVRGMLITLKLSNWKLADEVDAYLERIGSWGFRYVRARQLAFGGREICVAALRRKHLLRQHR